MASTEGPARAHDRHGRRKPFASWMKRLASLKSLHVDSNQNLTRRRSNTPVNTKSKKASILKNNPYPLATRSDSHNTNHASFSNPLSSQRSRHDSLSQSKHSLSNSHDSQLATKSRAPTLATTAETTISDAAPSGVGTSATAARTEGDRNSTFSSPAPSLRSVTTTLTTVQSTAPPLNNNTTNTNGGHATAINPSTSNNATQPATAVPAHLAPHSQLTTYHSSTANNLLTDDASILTLASSSKRRRKNSLDTNASVKALAPASMFGGSRESLPLSVLSGTIIHPGPPGGDTASLRDGHPRPTMNAERASLISASGVTAPALASERNSYIGSKYGDGASVRSGLLGAGGGHGRNDSISGSIGGRDLRDREKEHEREHVTASPSLNVDGSSQQHVNGNVNPSERIRHRQRSLDWADQRPDTETD